ncbi:MAG: hypothetical protein Q8K82_13240 [Gemmatimonadaceae bacterium]|nr:hypothetical protein [Gemmatimonadaceae bacterium]
MRAKDPSELLYDSEATLRLVDNAILDMGAIDADRQSTAEPAVRVADSRASSRHGGLGRADSVGGNSELLSVLDSLRQSRFVLAKSPVDKIQQTHEKLREVSDATETAATDVLNGLERATSMVDDLEVYAGEHAEPDDRAATIRGALRDELFALVGHMQFQDITSQQLNYALSVLTDVEARLVQIATVFDPLDTAGSCLLASQTGTSPRRSVCIHPVASTQNRAERQDMAGEVMLGKGASA